MSLIKKEIVFQNMYQTQCEQVLKALKMTCSQPCSQGGYRKKGLKCKFPVSAHTLSLKFKAFYEDGGIQKESESSSPKLTPPPHHR